MYFISLISFGKDLIIPFGETKSSSTYKLNSVLQSGHLYKILSIPKALGFLPIYIFLAVLLYSKSLYLIFSNNLLLFRVWEIPSMLSRKSLLPLAAYRHAARPKH